MPRLCAGRDAPAWPAVVVLAVIVGLVGGCSGGGKHSRTATSPSSSTSSASASAARNSHLLTIGSVHVQAAGRPVTLSRATQRAVLAIAQNYVDTAIMTPLEIGKLGREYASLFVPGIRPAVIGPDEPALTELAVGRTTTLSEQSSPVAISALADTSGALLYVATTFNVDVHATKPGGETTIDRRVELTFEPVGHGWSIVAYRVQVTRHAPAPAAPKRPSPHATTTRPPHRRTTTTRPSHRRTTTTRARRT